MAQFHTPNFFSYVFKFSLPMLVPVFVLVTLLFVRKMAARLPSVAFAFFDSAASHDMKPRNAAESLFRPRDSERGNRTPW